ncbi:hypothetical protein HanIR_Chr02g0052641 [Helianthus annuus]|nr:hypothetical protein HanIR_Chr02g0052641 [Helianthus annuus]
MWPKIMRALICLLLSCVTQDHYMTRATRVAKIVPKTNHHQVNYEGLPQVAYGLHKGDPSPPGQGHYHLYDPRHPPWSKTNHQKVNEQGLSQVAYGLNKGDPSPPGGRYHLYDPRHPPWSKTNHHQVNKQGLSQIAYGLHKGDPSPPGQGRYHLYDPRHPPWSKTDHHQVNQVNEQGLLHVAYELHKGGSSRETDRGATTRTRVGGLLSPGQGRYHLYDPRHPSTSK